MTQMGFYHNTDICIGCKACIISCKDKNDLPLGEKFRRVYDYANCDWDVDENGVCTPSNTFATPCRSRGTTAMSRLARSCAPRVPS